MITSLFPVEEGKITLSPVENQKVIEEHKKAATHLQAAAKHHLEAAKHHEDGDLKKSFQNIFLAQVNLNLASDAQQEVVKCYGMQNLTVM